MKTILSLILALAVFTPTAFAASSEDGTKTDEAIANALKDIPDNANVTISAESEAEIAN